MKIFNNRKRGFTLGEVLITLSIIGIVAALTMPSLMANHKKKVIETRLSNFYSKINNAIVLSEIDNGPKEDWLTPTEAYDNGMSIADWYETYIGKYFQGDSVEKLTDGNGKAGILVKFNDGSALNLDWWAWNFFPYRNEVSVKTTDMGETTAARKRDSVFGMEVFVFYFKPSSTLPRNKYHYGLGVEPYKVTWDGTKKDLYEDTTYGCGSSDNNSAFCTAIIQQNGWKIPDDYPFKF